MNSKSYGVLSTLSTFEERFRYLKLHGQVGADTFGYDRYINQNFYRSREWKLIRNAVIVRDGGCDLGISDRPIRGQIYIHHINPISLDDFENNPENLLDMNNLICVSFETHNALHYGDESILHKYDVAERKPYDTCPWHKEK